MRENVHEGTRTGKVKGSKISCKENSTKVKKKSSFRSEGDQDVVVEGFFEYRRSSLSHMGGRPPL